MGIFFFALTEQPDQLRRVVEYAFVFYAGGKFLIAMYLRTNLYIFSIR